MRLSLSLLALSLRLHGSTIYAAENSSPVTHSSAKVYAGTCAGKDSKGIYFYRFQDAIKRVVRTTADAQWSCGFIGGIAA